MTDKRTTQLKWSTNKMLLILRISLYWFGMQDFLHIGQDICSDSIFDPPVVSLHYIHALSPHFIQRILL